MRIILNLLCLLLALSMPVRANAADEVWKQHEPISRDFLKIINEAIPVMRRARPGWKNYLISVTELNDKLIVAFWRPEDVRSMRITGMDSASGKEILLATEPKYSGKFAVEFNKRSLKRERSYNVE